MKKLYLICLLVLIVPDYAFSQFNLQFGYGVAYASPSEINRLIYVYNNVNRASITKEMAKVHFFHGYTVGITYGDRFKIELSRTARRSDVVAEGEVNGEKRYRQLRIMSNTIGLGCQLALSRQWTVGLNYDVGNFKGFGRSAAVGDKPKLTRLFTLDNSIVARTQMGFTFFAQRNFGRLSARLYWQWQLLQKRLDIVDSWMLNGQQIIEDSQLQGKMSNLGFQVFFRIGPQN